jgi:SNF2 family DNA or RNA helicase
MIEIPEIRQTYETNYYKGELGIRCKKCNSVSFNKNDINNLYCGRCKDWHIPCSATIEASYKNGGIRNPDPVENSEPIKKDNIIYCEKCMEQMNPSTYNPKIFVCKSGHSAYLSNLVAVETKIPKVKEKLKRKIEKRCPKCGIVAETVKEEKIFGKIVSTYTCGHTEASIPLPYPADRDEKWIKFFPFQQEGIKFIEESNYRALIGDEMGLGKTIQAIGALRYNYQQLTPVLMICEASKVYDWKEEYITWNGDNIKEIPDEPIIHTSGQFGLVPSFRVHIISMSLIDKKKVLKSIENYGFKLVIVDESHSFKNQDAKRTFALQRICEVVPHVIFLSGTPVMNKVSEFFTTLNILRPSHFPSKKSLEDKCDKTNSGRVLGISSYYRDRFFRMTGEYVLRRTKKQVGIQLPRLAIHKLSVNCSSEALFLKDYNKELDKLQELLEKRKQGLFSTQDILGIFARLRHFIGLAKINPAIERVKEFLESTDVEDKICIGVHHKLVMDWIASGLKEYNPICVSDEDGLVKANKINSFKEPGNRVLIASILGAGQGLNIQFCKNALQVERQWNPAKEDQFYGRFHRIVKNADGSIKTDFDDQDDAVIIDIMNAKGSIDEYFDATVNLKKAIVDSTVDEELVVDQEFMMELAQKLVETRMYIGTETN